MHLSWRSARVVADGRQRVDGFGVILGRRTLHHMPL